MARSSHSKRQGPAPSEFNFRASAFLGSALGFAAALLIAGFAIYNNVKTHRLVDTGQVAEGTVVDRQSSNSGSDNRGGDTCFYNIVSYKVAGKAYQLDGGCHSDLRQPLHVPTIVDIPRLGPERPDQVVYLPSDPEVAKLRSEITFDLIPDYGTGGLFLLIGVVFGWFGLVVLKPKTAPKRRRRTKTGAAKRRSPPPDTSAKT